MLSFVVGLSNQMIMNIFANYREKGGFKHQAGITINDMFTHMYMTGPAKIDHLNVKNHQFLTCLLYHNFITIYTTATKSSSLLQNLMGLLLQLMEMR